MNDDNNNYNYKKYELLPSPITVNGHTVYKIKALKSFAIFAKLFNAFIL